MLIHQPSLSKSFSVKIVWISVSRKLNRTVRDLNRVGIVNMWAAHLCVSDHYSRHLISSYRPIWYIVFFYVQTANIRVKIWIPTYLRNIKKTDLYIKGHQPTTHHFLLRPANWNAFPCGADYRIEHLSPAPDTTLNTQSCFDRLTVEHNL